MSTVIQIRNVPEQVHRRLKVRAASEGISMSEYVLRQIKRSLDRPNRDELLRRVAELPPLKVRPPAARALREEREAR
ncbi:MAG: hypothetical protein ACE5I7_01395 [Candidatus Binatia bacterium]